jgi:RAB protein geranylgeranyltransferase component A
VVQDFQNVFFLVFFLKNVLAYYYLEKKVLHIDRNSFYGGEGASVNLTNLYKIFKDGKEPPK